MTSPESPSSSGPKDRDDQVDDPTGVHALLSSLPEPGPMPADLVDRIQASLREEADRREGSDERVTYALFAGRNRRASRGPWLRVAAVAALALFVGGGMLAGTGNLGPTALGMLGGNAARSATATGPATAAASSPLSALTPAPSADGHTPATSSPEQTFVQSRTNYAGGTLRDQARRLVTAPPPALPDLAAEAPHLGPIATPTGLASCLSALGLPPDAHAVVDLSTYEGRLGAILVTRHGDHDEVRVVKRACTTGDPELMAGPYVL